MHPDNTSAAAASVIKVFFIINSPFYIKIEKTIRYRIAFNDKITPLHHEGVRQVFPESPRQQAAAYLLSAMITFHMILSLPTPHITLMHRFLYLYI